MRASTPRIETRSEATLDCHTDAIMLREGVGAVGSTYLRGSPAETRALGSGTSIPESVGTRTVPSEAPPFAPPRRSAFADAKVAFVVGAGPVKARARARSSARTDRRRTAVAPRARASLARAVRGLGMFALGAAASASVGELAERALETAALACILAGVLLLLLALVRTRRGARRKRRAARGRD